MTALPEVYDALLAMWLRLAPQVDLDASQVFDGPTADFVGSVGVSIGTTVTDTTGQITYVSTDLNMDQGESTVAPFLIWAGSGSGPYKPLRDRVSALAAAFRADLAGNRQLDGVVGTSRIVNGAFDQQWITGRGPLVLFEQRLQYRRL